MGPSTLVARLWSCRQRAKYVCGAWQVCMQPVLLAPRAVPSRAVPASGIGMLPPGTRGAAASSIEGGQRPDGGAAPVWRRSASTAARFEVRAGYSLAPEESAASPPGGRMAYGSYHYGFRASDSSSGSLSDLGHLPPMSLGALHHVQHYVLLVPGLPAEWCQEVRAQGTY